MAYIGKIPATGAFQKCDSLNASATADYTLQVDSTNVVPESVNHMIVSLNGVIQAPTTAYTVSGATLSFASALTSNDTIDFVILLGNVLDIGTPSDDTVATAKIVADAVTEAKIADDAVESEHLNDNVISGQTALGAVPADTDELLISDAGTIKRVDYSYLKSTNTPSFSVTLASAQSISSQTSTVVTWDTEAIDTDSAFASNVFTIPAGEGGKYFFGVNLNIVSANMTQAQIFLLKNGSVTKKQMFITDGTQDNHSESITAVIDASAADYFGASLWVSGASTVTAGTESSFHGFKLI